MIAENREEGGKLVRQAWIFWALRQPNPKASWLAPWDDLDEGDKEADRCIWSAIAGPYIAEIAVLREHLDRKTEALYRLERIIDEHG